MIRFWRTFLCLCVVSLPLTRGQTCGWTFQQKDINDTAVNTQIAEIEIGQAFEFVSWSEILHEGGLSENTILSYFEQSSADNTFIVRTTENFVNLNNDAYTDGSNIIKFSISVKHKCGTSETQSTLLISVTNTNQNKPEFSKKSYTYTLPMPIMPKTDFSLFGDGDDDLITATDIDFSTTQMTFSISPDDFTVTSNKVANKKFQAVFRAKRILRFPDPKKTYTLTASDLGSPPQTNTVEITLNVDTETGLDSPSFTKSFYSYNYTSGDTPTLILTSEEITIQSDKPKEAFYALSEEYEKYFDVSFKNDSKTFSITTKPDTFLPEDITSPVAVPLTYTTDATTNTIILITVVKNEVIPEFTSAYYKATYNIDNDTFSWDKNIDVSNAVKVELSGDKSDLFTIDSTSYELKNINPLTKSDFDENLNIVLTLIATSSTGEARATAIISLPATTDEFRFDSVLYSGTYSVEDQTGKVVLDNDIGFAGITDFNGITISVDASYKEYFNVEIASNTWTVNVIKKLSSTILNDNTELAIPLTAKKTDVSNEANAILVLKLPEKVDIKFTKSVYVGTYIQSSGSALDNVIMDSDIALNEAVTTELTITLSDYTEYFYTELNEKTNIWTLKVKKPLPGEITENYDIIWATLAATRKSDNTELAKTSLVIKLPDRNDTGVPKFTKFTFHGDYKNETATVELPDFIGFTNLDTVSVSSVKIEESSTYSSSFSLNQMSGGTYEVKVIEPLSSEILSKESSIVFTIVAETADGNKGYAALVINLPKTPRETSIQFKDGEILYNGTYENGAFESPSITLVTKNTDDTQKSIKISNDLDLEDTYFTSSYAKNVLTVNVTDLPEEILQSYSVIPLKLAVTDKTTDDTVYVPDPSFSKTFYTAVYEVDKDFPKITSAQEIQVLNVEVADIEVKVITFSEYFYTQLDEKTNIWILKIKKPLSGDITEYYYNIYTTLAATRKSDNTELAKARMSILIDRNDTGNPKFTKFTFHGDYKNETATVELTDFIGFTNSDTVSVSSVKIEESSTYSSNFILNQKSDGNYEVNVSTPLSQDILSKESSIVLTIVADKTDGNKGYAALVINLPKTPRESSVHFENEDILYSGTYENGTFKPLSQISVKITNDLDLEDKYFTYKYANKVLTIDVAKLPKDIINKYAVIPLKLAITDSTTGDTIHAVLNVNNNDKDNNPSSNGGKPTENDRKGLLIAVIILACLLVLLIAAAFFLWYFKLRKNKYTEMEEDEVEKTTTKPTFTKNLTRQPSQTSNPTSLRRPTGLPIGVVPPESPTDDASSEFEAAVTKESSLTSDLDVIFPVNDEKKVVFDDNVQQINDNDHDDNDDNDEDSGHLQNVADRRPTKFVFGYPLEEGIFDDDTTGRRESSDYVGTDPDRKKSVVFDDNVERMQIDVVEDDDDEEDGLTEADKKRFKAELEVKVKEHLPPSEILKEIF